MYQDITAAMPWMVKGLADALGVPSLYNKEGMNTDLIIGAEGQCIIKNKVLQSPGYDDKHISTIGSFLPKADMPNNDVYEKDHLDDLPF